MFYQVRYVAYTIPTRGMSIRQTLFSELRSCRASRNVQHVQPGRLRLHAYRGLSPISDNLQTCLQDTGKLVQCFGSNIEVRVGVCKWIFHFCPFLRDLVLVRVECYAHPHTTYSQHTSIAVLYIIVLCICQLSIYTCIFMIIMQI